jgi:hypothetical protein
MFDFLELSMIIAPDVRLLKLKPMTTKAYSPVKGLRKFSLMPDLTLTNFNLYSHILIFAACKRAVLVKLIKAKSVV